MAKQSWLRHKTAELLRITHLKWLARRFSGYRRLRQHRFGTDLSQLACPGTAGLVSIVLPVFNGGKLLATALDSVLAQDYPHWELICINDGSHDDTPRILAEYAAREPRIRVYHQENRKIPRTLSRGFRLARGEFLTWTSADNRLKPEFLRRLVESLSRHPSWDLVYANLDIIGEDGLPLRGSEHFAHLQSPPGSEHVHLPSRNALLHSDGNYVGAAFMYRSRVAQLLGDYSSQRFTVEDYDYWLICDTLLNVHHADFPEPIYEYRFHDASLTSRGKELRIAETRERLLAFDGVRQEFCLGPLTWICEEDGVTESSSLLSSLHQQLAQLEHNLSTRAQLDPLALPRYFFPVIYLRIGSAEQCQEPPPPLPAGTLSAFLLRDSAAPIPSVVHPSWEVVSALGTGDTPPRYGDSYQGLWRAEDVATLLRALDCRGRVKALRELEMAVQQTPSSQHLSVIVDGDQELLRLSDLIESLLLQDLPQTQLEILILLQQAPDREPVRGLLTRLRTKLPPGLTLRLLDIPFASKTHRWTLSSAIAEARAEIVCLLTAPPQEHSLLRQLQNAFAEQPHLALLLAPVAASLPLGNRSLAARRKPLLEVGGVPLPRRRPHHGPVYGIASSLAYEVTLRSQLQRLGYDVAESTALLHAPTHSQRSTLRILPPAPHSLPAMFAQSLRTR